MTFPAELVPELRWHLERFAAPGERDLVFVGPKGAALRRSNFRPIWNAACAHAGVPGMHFHDLRHVGGTLAAATGASLKELMARLGHSSTRAAMIYQHATRDRDEGIAKALGGLMHQVRSDPHDQLGRLRLGGLRPAFVQVINAGSCPLVTVVAGGSPLHRARNGHARGIGTQAAISRLGVASGVLLHICRDGGHGDGVGSGPAR